MFGYIHLIRPLNCLMTSIAVFIGVLLVAGWAVDFYSIILWSAVIAAFLIAGAGNAINDYADIESDRVNRPRRPIPSGRVSPRSALVFSAVLFITGIILAGFINYMTFFIAVFNSVILIVYSFRLKDKILIGNIAVSYLVGSSFLFGGAAMVNIPLPLLLMLLAFFSNLSREIVKDLEDVEGDKKDFMKRLISKFKKPIASIAERFGVTAKGVSIKNEKELLLGAQLSLIFAIIVSPFPYILDILSSTYLIFLIPADLVFLISAVLLERARKRKTYGKISKIIKLGMFLGLIAFIVGILL